MSPRPAASITDQAVVIRSNDDKNQCRHRNTSTQNTHSFPVACMLLSSYACTLTDLHDGRWYSFQPSSGKTQHLEKAFWRHCNRII